MLPGPGMPSNWMFSCSPPRACGKKTPLLRSDCDVEEGRGLQHVAHVGEVEVLDHLVGDDGDGLRRLARGEGELGRGVGGGRGVEAGALGGAGGEAGAGAGYLDGVEEDVAAVVGGGLLRGDDAGRPASPAIAVVSVSAPSGRGQPSESSRKPLSRPSSRLSCWWLGVCLAPVSASRQVRWFLSRIFCAEARDGVAFLQRGTGHAYLSARGPPGTCAAVAGIGRRVPKGSEITMDFEKFSERARGFVQAAQTIAHPREPPAVPAGASAEGAARRRPGAGGEPDQAGGRRSGAGAGGGRRGARQGAAGRGRRRPALHGRADREGAGRGGEAREAGRRQLRHRRADADGAGGDQVGRERRAEGGGRDGAGAERGDQRHPQGPHRRHRERRAGL